MESQQPYRYQRYPLVMHKGTHPNITSKHVNTEAEERALAAEGYSTRRPVVPEAVEPDTPVTLEDRVQELEDKLAALIEQLTPAQETTKRGPGRPRKEPA